MSILFKVRFRLYSSMVLLLFLLVASLDAACTPPAGSPEANRVNTIQSANSSSIEEASSISKQAWEIKWDKTLAEARKEGKVVIYVIFGPEVRNPLSKAFKSKYGIDVEFVSGRGPEMAQKVIMERKMGLEISDLYISGANTVLSTMKPAGVVQPLDPFFILPEVTETKYWWEGKLPFIDKDHTILALSATPAGNLLINNQLTSKEEVYSYKDLLAPKWKGKIILDDPTIAGTGLRWSNFLIHIMGVDYLRGLAKQEPIITRDIRLEVEWVARGKYPVAVPIIPSVAAEFIKDGAPIETFLAKEGGWLDSGFIYLVALTSQPHPNAATIFINWISSREGGAIANKFSEFQSAREDISADYLEQARRRLPGVKYIEGRTEEFSAETLQRLPLMKEIFGPLTR